MDTKEMLPKLYGMDDSIVNILLEEYEIQGRLMSIAFIDAANAEEGVEKTRLEGIFYREQGKHIMVTEMLRRVYFEKFVTQEQKDSDFEKASKLYSAEAQ